MRPLNLRDNKNSQSYHKMMTQLLTTLDDARTYTGVFLSRFYNDARTGFRFMYTPEICGMYINPLTPVPEHVRTIANTRTRLVCLVQVAPYGNNHITV